MKFFCSKAWNHSPEPKERHLFRGEAAADRAEPLPVQLEAAKERLKAVPLLPGEGKEILNKIQDKPRHEQDVYLDRLHKALDQYDIIVGMKAELTPEAFNKAMDYWRDAYSNADLDLSAEEITRIHLLLSHADARLDLAEESSSASGSPVSSTPEAPPVITTRSSGNAKTLMDEKPVEMHSDFRGDKSWEHLTNLKDMDNGGQAIYTAINQLSAISNTLGRPMDNRGVWQAIRGDFTKFKIGPDALCRAIYGKNSKKFLEDYKKATGEERQLMELFMQASEKILNNIDKATKNTEKSMDKYKETRETAIEARADNPLIRNAKHFFDPYSYGPLVRLNIFQQICFGLSPKERPVITEDNWNDAVARKDSSKRNNKYGEIQIISESRAFDKLTGLENKEELLKKLNKYLDFGKEIANQVNDSRKNGHKEKFTNTAATITIDNLNDAAWQPSEDQIAAVRHGMMAEAARELKVYQDVADSQEAMPEGEIPNPVAQEIMQSILNDPRVSLTEAQQKELSEDISRGLSASFGVFATYDGETVSIGQLAALHQQLRNGFHLSFIAQGNVLAPIVTPEDPRIIDSLGADIGWTSKRFGKNGRMQAGVFAGMGWNFEEQAAYARIGGYLKGNFETPKGETSAWGWKLGAQAGVTLEQNPLVNIGMSLGLTRDIDIAVDRKLDKYRAKHAEQIANAKTALNTKIADFKGATPEDKAALIYGAEAYLDMLLDKQLIDSTSPIQFGEIGLVVGAGLKNGRVGVAPGIFASIHIGAKSVTMYSAPRHTLAKTAADIFAAGSVVSMDKMREPESDWVRLDLPDEILWSGDATAKEAALAKARESRDAALKSINENAKNKDIKLTAGEKWTKVEFPKVEGFVELYIDDDSYFEFINDDGNFYLNMDKNEMPEFKISQVANGFGGRKEVIITLSSSTKSQREIIANSSQKLEWIQAQNTVAHAKLSNNPAKTGTSTLPKKLLNLGETTGLATKNMGDEGLEQWLTEVKRDDMVTFAPLRREAALFADIPADIKTKAETAANALIRAGMNYDAMATDAVEKTTINDKVKAALITAGIEKPTFEQIIYTRQKLMEKMRPNLGEVPLTWNHLAFRHISESAAPLAKDYFARNREAINRGELKGEFPEGTQFSIFINENGIRSLPGYYSKDIHGQVSAMIKWDSDNPAATLTQLGIASDAPHYEAFKAAVKDVYDTAQTPAHWSNTYNSVPTDAGVQRAGHSYAGTLLLGAESPYTADQRNTLLELVAGEIESSDATTALEDSFISAARALSEEKVAIINGKALLLKREVYTGLYDACHNLCVGVAPVLLIKDASTTESRIGMGSTETERILEAREDVDAITVTTPVIGVPTGPGKTPEKSEPKKKASEVGDASESAELPEDSLEGDGDGAEESPR